MPSSFIESPSQAAMLPLSQQRLCQPEQQSAPLAQTGTRLGRQTARIRLALVAVIGSMLVDTVNAQATRQVTGLNLMQGGTSTLVASLFDGIEIRLPAGVTTTNFGVDAIVSGGTGPLQGVQFGLNSNADFRKEYAAPYGLCSNVGPNLTRCPELTVGTHTITAKTMVPGTPNTTPFTVRVTIISGGGGPPAPVPIPVPVPVPVPIPTLPTASGITALRLIHAPTQRELLTLTNSLVVDPVALGVSAQFNVAAIVGSNVQSVLFLPTNRAESTPPFAFCGDTAEGAYYTCNELIANGAPYTITARGYTGKWMTGTALPDVSVTFSIKAPGGGPVPVPVPIPAPVPAPVPVPVPVPIPAPVPVPVPVPVAPQPTPPIVTTFQTIRVNCGGLDYTDNQGNLWMADKFFVGGSTYVNVANDIIGTTDDTLFHSERYGPEFTYSIPVPLGEYEIIFLMAEIYFKLPNERIFDIEVEGNLVQNIDIIQQSGGVPNKAIQREALASVDDGLLSIRFLTNTPMVNFPKISAIVVKLTAPHLAHAVSEGPYTVTDSNGDGVEAVPVNAIGSHAHGDGNFLTSSTWKLGSTVIGTGLSTSLSLPVGEHTVSITVKDNTGDSSTDSTTITVRSAGFPNLASISPNSGPVAGGTVVTLTGTSFTGATSVRFGLATLTGSAITVVSATTIRVTSPLSGVDAPVEVSVVTPTGVSNSRTFEYIGAVPISFTIGKLMDFARPTAIAFGPDGRLYVGNTQGQLGRFTLNDTFDSVVGPSLVVTVVSNQRGIHGITFDPAESADTVHPTIYVSTSDIFHGESVKSSGGVAINGKIQAVRGANMDQVSDIVTGLPVCAHDHTVNGIYFGNNGELYISVGSNTNGGIPGELSPARTLKDNYLSSAVLVANLGKPNYDGNIRYDKEVDGDPIAGFGSNGVEIFASGLRNAYGIVQHTNGEWYCTDNGPNPNYGDMATGCAPGEQIPDQYEKDKLIRLVRGNYYGAPNLKRGATDPRQCVWRAASLPSGNGYTAPMMKLSSSTNGITEFDSAHFNGQMRGNLIVSKYQGPLNRIILSADGLSVSPSSNPAILLGGADTLCVTQAPNGNLVDTRYQNNADSVHFYRPKEPPTTTMSIKAVFPRRGVLAGGTKFTIYGVNFAAGASVTVGGNTCDSVNVLSANRIECRLPGGTLGIKDVVVTIGTASNTFARGYRYITGRPL